MAINVISADTSTTIVASKGGDTWVVKAGVYVTTAGDAIDGTGTGTGKTFAIYGNLISESSGIRLGDFATGSGGSNRVDIAATGSVVAKNYGIYSIGGNFMLTNEGSISSGMDAIFAAGGQNRIVNRGAMDGLRGIQAGGGDNTVNNSGSILAINTAIWVMGGSSLIDNSGSLTSSNSQGITADDGSNVISNTGSISAGNGIVATGSGDWIGNSGTVSAANYGILASGSDAVINNSGGILAEARGVWGNGNAEITNTGTITAGTGIWLTGGGNFVSNLGNVSGTSNAVRAYGTGNFVHNGGTLSASSANADDFTSSAVGFDSQAGEINKLVNDGKVIGYNAVLSGGGNETIVNRGVMSGEVALGLGNDVFKGRHGVLDGGLHGGGGNDLLIGGSGGDSIFGDTGSDTLKGFDGDDTLTGGSGRDIMAGGAGADVFDFNKVSDSAVGASRDRITDFDRGEDMIDLSTIDASTAAAGNQAFTFIGGAFSGTAGELNAVMSSGNTIVSGDVDGDAVADFQVLVIGVSGMNAADFVL